ncbi:PaaX family transcriptional regulator C-terminal domain-containing protein, partial [Kibdelosporangium lantanae]
LAEHDVTEHAGLLLGSPAGSVDFSRFVTRVWDLDSLDHRYREFVDEFSGSCPKTDRQALILRTRLAHSFRQFPFLDPELPTGLVPAPAHRATAVRMFHDLYTALAPAAMRHFDEVMQP